MSARESIKGYLYQTLIALLQMLDDDTWSTVSIEPKEVDEKVDIYWEGTQTIAMQVKSSKSRINKTSAQRYAEDLTSHYPNAHKYELILCAHVTSELKNGESLAGATLRINNSQPIDLTQQAAQRLDTFLHRHSISQTPPLIRELLTRALISRLIDFSTGGMGISRTEFEEQIKSWVLICYPEAARNSRFSMCEVANGPCHMMLIKTINVNTGQPSDDEELQFISDLHFVNVSNEPSIIQFVVFSLTVAGIRHFFIPRFFYDPTKVDTTHPPEQLADHQKGLEIFQPICVVPKGIEHRKLVASSLRSEVSSKFLLDNRNSEFLIEVFVKYYHLDSYLLAHAFNPNILFDELFKIKQSIAYYLPDIEQDKEALRQPIARMT
jgi:hypothetical protein